MPLNTEEEARFKKLREDCRSLGVPAPPEIHIQFVVRDKDGHIITSDTQRGRSWTRNFYNWMFSQMTQTPTTGEDNFGAGFITAKDTGGVNRRVAGYGAGISGDIGGFSTAIHGYASLINTSNAGIVVGTDDTAFSANHVALGAIIASGTGSGQLSYQAQARATPSYDDTTDAEKWVATFVRNMNNNSGASITIKEIGLYFRCPTVSTATFFTSVTNSSYMTERSVLDPTLLVPNGGTLSVTYIISMAFSAID